ncbi:MAG: MerR family transcriptional regulator, partial [Longimicrobiales bacterium]
MNSPSSSREARHPIRVVASRTGLTPTLLRAWERRYGVVEPGRSDGGQRLYSDDDIERLVLLKRATDAGRAIRLVADLTVDELRDLVQEDRSARAPAQAHDARVDRALAAAWAAV